MLCAQVDYPAAGGVEIRIFKEYCLRHPRNKTRALCEAFLLEFGDQVQQAFIYGDASGNRNDTREARNDYQIATAALRKIVSGRSLRVQSSNPSVRKRILFANAIFEGKIRQVRVLIDAGCHNLINDLLLVKEDANGNKAKTRTKENGISFEQYGHTSDAFDYLITTVLQREFQNFAKLLTSVNG
jgi:phage terminase large subunit